MRMSSFNYMPRFGVDAADLHWLRLFPAMPNAFHRLGRRVRIALGFAGKLGLEGLKLALHALDRQPRPLQTFFGGLDGTFKGSGTRRLLGELVTAYLPRVSVASRGAPSSETPGVLRA